MIPKTYDLLENVNLIEKHALLLVVHVALPEDLDSSLGARLSVHAHAHFTESSSAEDFADTVEVSQAALGSSDEVRG